MIDLHSHLLSGPQGSPETFKTELEICRRAVRDGVRTLVATPRWRASADGPQLSLTDCWQRLERLHHELDAALSFRLGYLLEFRSGLPNLLEKHGSNISLGGGRFLFVALPALQVPLEAEAVWSKISEKGFSVLLSRPECSPALRRDSLRLEQWIKSGVYVQLDAASITGMHGQEIQHFAFQCLKKYEGHVILASGAGGERARPASLASAREELLKKNPSHKLRRLLDETPAAIVGDEQKASQEDERHAFRLSQLLRLRSQRAVPDES